MTDKKSESVNNHRVYNISDEDNDVMLCDEEDSDVILCDDYVSVVNDDSTPSSVDDISVFDVKSLNKLVEKDVCYKVLFKNHFMEPMSFLLLLHDFSLELKVSKLIEDCGGLVYTDKNEIDDWCIVLVKDDSLYWNHRGPVFKVSYIQKCVKLCKTVSISPYLKPTSNFSFTSDFEYMCVVYFKKYKWNDIPEKFLKTSVIKERNNAEKIACVSSDSDSDVQSVRSVSRSKCNVSMQKKSHKLDKHSRMPYSIKEDEDIIKFVVAKKGYNLLKGNAFWKNMESRDVCPQRTWQSMKEHFIKKLIYRLNNFNFLTEKQKHTIQTVFFNNR